MYQLYIANKNYSSWSLRPWVLMHERQIPFVEHLLRFGEDAQWQPFRKLSPSGKVPCLVDGDALIWDSLAIVEYLAERHEGIWPASASARTWARSAAAEMHSGFGELRNRCSMSCGISVRLHLYPPALASDVERLSALWNDGLERFGGSYLAGSTFTAVDAFFAPVAFRIRSYGLDVSPAAAAYCKRLLSLPAMQRWYEEALRETFREAEHEDHTAQLGTVLEDLRATLTVRL